MTQEIQPHSENCIHIEEFMKYCKEHGIYPQSGEIWCINCRIMYDIGAKE